MSDTEPEVDLSPTGADAGYDDDLTVNMSGVQAMGGFDLIPSGRYTACLTDWSKTETQNAGKLPAGTPGINAEFTIQEGEHENRKLWNNFWVAPTTIGFAKGFLKATDEFTDDELEADGFSLRDAFTQAVGKPFIIVVGQGKDRNNEMRNRINGYKSLAEGGAESAGGAGSLMP
jgi:hypothetical protein